MKNPIKEIKEALKEMKGDPLEDVLKIVLFAVICSGLGIIALGIKGIIWLIENN